MDVQIGSVVISKAGRDKGYFLAVVALGENSITVSDGKERPLSRPKQKNLRHLSITGYVLSAEQMCSDRSLRRVINELRAKPNTKGEFACQNKI